MNSWVFPLRVVCSGDAFRIVDSQGIAVGTAETKEGADMLIKAANYYSSINVEVRKYRELIEQIKGSTQTIETHIKTISGGDNAN